MNTTYALGPLCNRQCRPHHRSAWSGGRKKAIGNGSRDETFCAHAADERRLERVLSHFVQTQIDGARRRRRGWNDPLPVAWAVSTLFQLLGVPLSERSRRRVMIDNAHARALERVQHGKVDCSQGVISPQSLLRGRVYSHRFGNLWKQVVPALVAEISSRNLRHHVPTVERCGGVVQASEVESDV